MSIFKKLTLKDLKLNKKRTIGTLIGIILSVALITAVGGMFFVLQNSLIDNSIKHKGYYHIQLSDVSENQLNTVKQNKDFSHIETVYDLGHSFQEISNNATFYSRLYSMSSDTAEYLKYNIIEGSFPKDNGKEVAINSYYAKRLDLKIGDKVKIVSGDIIDEEGNTVNNYSYGDEELINTVEYEFTVVGMIDGYTRTIVTNGVKTEKIDVYLTLKNPINYMEDMNELLGTKKIGDKSEIYDYAINTDLLRWEVFYFSDAILSVLAGLVIVVIFIILITSVFSIRNSFAISTTEKIKTYGMLLSVGATKKQIKKMVLLEGVYLGGIGIPIGTILGIFVIWALTQIVNLIGKNGGVFNDASLIYKFSILPALLAIIVGVIMIYWSIIKCARRASKVTPIQNIRNADNLNSKKIKLKVPVLIKKIFKIGGILSYKNLKRSKRKYRITVISLTISIFVFITVSSVVEYGMKSIKEIYIDAEYNVIVNDYENNKKTFNDKEKFEELKNLESSYVAYSQVYDPENYEYYGLLDTSRVLYDEIITSYGEDGNKKGVMTVEKIYDSEYFKFLADKLNKKFEDIKDKIIIVNKVKDASVNDRNVFVKPLDYKEGEILTLTSNKTDKTLSFEIGAIIEEMPLGEENSYSNNAVYLIMNKDYLNLEVEPSSIYYNSENPEELVVNIEKRFPNVMVFNLDEQAKAAKTLLIIFSIFIYGFIIVVTLIGTTSVFNTITSNMELRKNEFAMLKSIGMTKGEFNNMIYLESLFYSFKSLFYGIILGLIGSVVVYKVFSQNWDFGYILPKLSIIISCLFVFVMVVVIMKYSIGKIGKQNIIETIRSENI